MSIFQTTPEQKLRLYDIASRMGKEGLDPRFITSAVEFANIYEGAFLLCELWFEEEDSNEKDRLIAEIQHEIEDWQDMPAAPVKKPYISFDDLEKIGKDVRAYKNNLKAQIDKWGGVTKLAKATGIPQPSLSKMLNSNSMPRRTTLYKIADAMGLSEGEIVTEWLV